MIKKKNVNLPMGKKNVNMQLSNNVSSSNNQTYTKIKYNNLQNNKKKNINSSIQENKIINKNDNFDNNNIFTQQHTIENIELKIINPNKFNKTPSNIIFTSQTDVYLFSQVNNIKENIKNQTIMPNKIINNISNKTDIFNDNDLIIYTENCLEDKNTLLYFSLSYQLYNYDCSFVDNGETNEIFYDNYNGNINISKAFAFKYKYFKNLEKYDGDYITDYYQKNKLYAVGLNFNNENSTFENKYNNDYICNIPNIYTNFKKNILTNVQNLYHDYQENNNQVDIKYFNKNIFIITLTPIDNDEYNDSYKFKFLNATTTINIQNTYNKCTYLIETNVDLDFYQNNNFIEIFQINNHYDNKIMNISDFYKMMTIINYNKYAVIKNYTYSNIDVYMQTQDKLIQKIYNTLNSKSLKVLLFKLLKLYEGNTMYIGKNVIQYNHINSSLDTIFYIKQEDEEYDDSIIYLGKLSNKIFSGTIKLLLSYFWQKITHYEYGKLFGRRCIDIIIPPELIYYTYNKNYIIDKNNILFFKLSKNIFIEEYENDKKNNKLYNESFIYDQYNGIDKIVWINLDRSIERKNNMENILKKINITNERISAIDGINDIDKYYTIKHTNINNKEKACTLSHFKAFANLKKSEGNYFLVCEDDVMLDTIIIYDIDINKIIADAPGDFDILMIHAISENLILNDNLYTKRKRSSTACYIITKKAVDKLNNIIEYNNSTDTFNYSNIEQIDVADKYIYNLVNTYEYKYNLVSTSYNNSTITIIKNNTENKINISQQNGILMLNLYKLNMFLLEYFNKNNMFIIDNVDNFNKFINIFIKKYRKLDINNKKYYEFEKINYIMWKLSVYKIYDNTITEREIYLYDETSDNIKINKNITSFIDLINEIIKNCKKQLPGAIENF